jgi:ribosomal protein S18 acetylase RimI-like enzyme
MELEPVNLSSQNLILSIFEKAPNYFLQVEGCLPTLATVNDAILCAPVKTTQAYVKQFLVIRDHGQPVGTVELHINHPATEISYIGLLLVCEDLQSRGVGRECYRAVENYVRQNHAAKIIRLGVSDDNDVSGFWSRLGFRSNGRHYSYAGERKVNNVVEYEKKIT